MFHPPCCTHLATSICTSPRHFPAHHPRRRFSDPLRRDYSRKGQLRRDVCGLATRTSSQVMSPRMTRTMIRKSRLSSSLTSMTTNPISSLILSQRAIRQFENMAAGKQQQALFSVKCLCEPQFRKTGTERERERVRGRQSSASERTGFRDISSAVGVEGSMLWWKKRDRSSESATLRDRQNLHEFLERQAQLAVLGESAALRKLTAAESDVEVEE